MALEPGGLSNEERASMLRCAGYATSMGIGYLGATMLWNARQRGVSFDETLTLGHLSLRLFSRQRSVLRSAYQEAFGRDITPLDGYLWGEYVDKFVEGYLGASSISVLDASSYQGANTIHDMNIPVSKEWHGRYDAVIDGGSLEHIFNVPVAFANLANMLKIGGSVFLNSPANNLMGHGFYQFSPELMFRIFSEANGFRIDNVYLYEADYPSVELSRNEVLYKVTDPEAVRKRVGLLNKKPVIMMVEATRISGVQMFATPPLQSDYVVAWESTGQASSPAPRWRNQALRCLDALPMSVGGPLRGLREKRKFALRNGAFYTRQRW